MAHTGAWVLAITLVATSGIGIYYYLRIINAMFERPEGREAAAPAMAPGGEKFPDRFSRLPLFRLRCWRYWCSASFPLP